MSGLEISPPRTVVNVGVTLQHDVAMREGSSRDIQKGGEWRGDRREGMEEWTEAEWSGAEDRRSGEEWRSIGAEWGMSGVQRGGAGRGGTESGAPRPDMGRKFGTFRSAARWELKLAVFCPLSLSCIHLFRILFRRCFPFPYS